MNSFFNLLFLCADHRAVAAGESFLRASKSRRNAPGVVRSFVVPPAKNANDLAIADEPGRERRAHDIVGATAEESRVRQDSRTRVFVRLVLHRSLGNVGTKKGALKKTLIEEQRIPMPT